MSTDLISSAPIAEPVVGRHRARGGWRLRPGGQARHAAPEDPALAPSDGSRMPEDPTR